MSEPVDCKEVHCWNEGHDECTSCCHCFERLFFWQSETPGERREREAKEQRFEAQRRLKEGRKLIDSMRHHSPNFKVLVILNEWFEGSHFHHMGNGYAIYIPAELHRSYPHSLTQNREMRRINRASLDWLREQKQKV